VYLVKPYYFFVLVVIIVVGCNDGDKSAGFGIPISDRKTTSIAALFDDPTAYKGKTVTLRGVIDEQDQRGFWFYMQDDDARIYVEIQAGDSSLPDLTMKKILAEGVVEVNLNIPSLLASGVQLQQ
jgi:hypothetical protein